MKTVLASVVAGMLAAGMAVAGDHQGPQQTAEAQQAKITSQTTCPVMGGKVNRDLYVDHGGKRVYVCCEGCIDAVKKDPEKYIKKLEADGVALDPAGKGKAIVEEAQVGHEGDHH